MNLRSYLAHQKITTAAFAKEIDVSVTALHRYLTGDRVPRTEVLERIVRVTNGTVQPNDFFTFGRPTVGPLAQDAGVGAKVV